MTQCTEPGVVPELKKILIIEDDIQAGRTLKALLDRTGKYDASLEHEGVRAVDTATRLRPDVILMDIVMPNVEGTTLAYRMRAHAALRDTPVIFLTGIVPKEASSTQSKLGDFPFIAKPLDVQEVIAGIEQALAG